MTVAELLTYLLTYLEVELLRRRVTDWLSYLNIDLIQQLIGLTAVVPLVFFSRESRYYRPIATMIVLTCTVLG